MNMQCLVLPLTTFFASTILSRPFDEIRFAYPFLQFPLPHFFSLLPRKFGKGKKSFRYLLSLEKSETLFPIPQAAKPLKSEGKFRSHFFLFFLFESLVCHFLLCFGLFCFPLISNPFNLIPKYAVFLSLISIVFTTFIFELFGSRRGFFMLFLGLFI